MSHVIAASSSAQLTKRLRLASEDDLTVLRPDQVPATPGQLLALVDDPARVSTIVLDVSPGQCLPNQALELTRMLKVAGGPISVLIVSDDVTELALPALRAGAGDLIPSTVEIPDLRLALREAVDDRDRRLADPAELSQGSGGRVVTVVSPKGGVGKTTLAANLALGLAKHSPQGTVLVDLDVQFGDVASALDLDPTYTLGDIAASPVPDILGLKALLTSHHSGLQVVSGVHSPAEADRIGVGRVGELLDVLKREFRYVVVDSAPGMSEQMLASLDHTTDLVLVTSLDVPGIRGTRKTLDLLDQLTLPAHTRHLILNMVDRHGGLSVADAEETLGSAVDLVLQRSGKVARSTNRGIPMMELHPSDSFSKGVADMVTRFAPPLSRRGRRSANGAHRLWARA